MVSARRPTYRAWRLRGARHVCRIVAALVTIVPRTAAAHPLHTTLTEVRLDPRDGAVTLTVRAFVDDFSAAAYRFAAAHARTNMHPSMEDAVRSYVLAGLSITDASGRPLVKSWGGMRQDGGVVFLTLRVPAARTLDGVRLGSTLLLERFEDQVNIVQVDLGARRRSLLFTRDDRGALKSLR